MARNIANGDDRAARLAWARAHVSSLGPDPASGVPAGAPRVTVRLTPRDLSGHHDRVRAVDAATMPDGRVLLATGSDTARIWDAATGELLHVLPHAGVVQAVAFGSSADGLPLLATGSRDRTAALWDPLTGEMLHMLPAHSGDVRGVAIGRTRADDVLVATCSSDGRILLWAADSGTCVRRFEPRSGTVFAVALASNPAGRLFLAVTTEFGAHRLWDADTGWPTGGMTSHSRIGLQSLVLAPGHRGGLLLGLGGTDHFAVSRIRDGKTLLSVRTEARVASLALRRDDDGRVLVAAAHGRRLDVWEVADDTSWRAVYKQPDESKNPIATYEHPADVNAVCFAETLGGASIATACDDHTARIFHPPRESGPEPVAWQTGTPSETARPGRMRARPAEVPGSELSDRPLAVALVPNAGGVFALVAVTDRGTRHSWTVLGGAVEESGPPPATVGDTEAAVIGSDDHGALCHLSHGADRIVYFTRTVKQRRRFAAQRRKIVPPVRAAGHAWGAILTRRRSGELLAAVSTRAGVEIRKPATGEIVTILGEAGDTARILAPHAEQEYVFAVADVGILQIWDNDQGLPVRTMTLPEGAGTQAVALTTDLDGKSLVALDERSAVSVWDPDTGARLRTFADHRNEMWALAFGRHPDGTLVLASAGGNEIRLYDARNGELLATVPVRLAGRGAVALRTGPDGQLYLAAGTTDRRILLWSLTGGEVSGDGEWEFELRPEIETLPTGETVRAVAAMVTRDGIRIAASVDGGGVVIHDVSAQGEPRRVMVANGIRGLAVGSAVDGRNLMVVGCSAPSAVHIFDIDDGGHVGTLDTPSGFVNAVALGNLADGTLVAASAGFAGTRLWNVLTGELLHETEGHVGQLFALQIGRTRGGDVVVATATSDQSAQLWFPGTDRPVQNLTVEGGRVYSVALAQLPDGTAIAATGGTDRLVRIWDVESGRLLHLIGGQHRDIFFVDFVAFPSGSVMLVSAGDDRRIQLIDPVNGEVHATAHVDTGLPWTYSKITVVPEDGRTLLVGIRRGAAVELRRIDLRPPGRNPQDGGTARPVSQAAVRGLIGLAQHSLHPPLGLLADLISLIGGAPGRNGLHALRGHPGLARLVELRWPPNARTGLAALLLEDLAFGDRFKAPNDNPQRLMRSLNATLARYTGPYQQVPVDLPALTAAADRVSASLVTLLSVLGAAAVAADPGLPLRLRHQADTMPFVPPRLLELLSTQQPILDLRPSPGVTERTTSANETTGISRRGLLTNLLGTQLALPDELFRIRVELDELLYRTRRTQRPPTVLPATLILDTTPPTFGPAETVLRLVAHSLTTAAWAAATDLALVTFDRPGVALPLVEPADLVPIWTGRTLQPADLTVALDTAGQLGRPRTILLTQHQLLVDSGIRPASTLRVLTTHVPGNAPRGLPPSPDHVHLPPDPAPAAILRAVLTLLRP
jgi:WD40 repeat protein